MIISIDGEEMSVPQFFKSGFSWMSQSHVECRNQAGGEVLWYYDELIISTVCIRFSVNKEPGIGNSRDLQISSDISKVVLFLTGTCS